MNPSPMMQQESAPLKPPRRGWPTFSWSPMAGLLGFLAFGTDAAVPPPLPDNWTLPDDHWLGINPWVAGPDAQVTAMVADESGGGVGVKP